MNYGRYEILKELGRGAMGVVYQAHDPHIDRMVALKILRQDRVVSEDFVQRFLREARAIGRLSHANIVTVYDVGQDHDTIYIAMEYLEGRPLNDVAKEGRLGFEEIVHIGIQVAQALEYAHQKGIIHRDIKPSNIILTPDGQAKLTDFGIARIEDLTATQQTVAGEILGTPIYMSPEQSMGKTVDGRSDLYSLGVILYELAVGRRPFQGENLAVIFRAITQDTPAEPAVVDHSIPHALSDLIMKSLRKTPDERYQNGKEMGDALSACIKKETDFLQQPTVEGKPQRVGLLVLIVFIMTCLAAGIYFYASTGKLKDDVVLSVLKVDSVPLGAQVFLDDSFKGKTPLELELPVGKYEVRLSLNHYNDWEAQVQLNKDVKTPLNIRLLPTDEMKP